MVRKTICLLDKSSNLFPVVGLSSRLTELLLCCLVADCGKAGEQSERIGSGRPEAERPSAPDDADDLDRARIRVAAGAAAGAAEERRGRDFGRGRLRQAGHRGHAPRQHGAQWYILLIPIKTLQKPKLFIAPPHQKDKRKI